MFVDGIMGNILGMLEQLRERIGSTASDVAKTPQTWNSGIFETVRELSETAIIPVAAIILTYVVCYELIQMVIADNNMNQFEPVMLFKWIVKTAIGIFLLTHTFDIIMGVFDLSQWVIMQANTVMGNEINITAIETSTLRDTLNQMSLGDLLLMYLQVAVVSLAMKVLSIVIFIVVSARMMQIYLTISLAPIPVATMTNKEWGQIGNGYIKQIFALAFQGALIIVCLAIYARLATDFLVSGGLETSIWTLLGNTVLLGYMLIKTGGIAQSIFQAH
ncbi:MAG: hypothetical protein LBR85_09020 [Oscillospiraceae bacterium]|nr:hypothetical protein [Oscillospiraceae bacterium]